MLALTFRYGIGLDRLETVESVERSRGLREVNSSSNSHSRLSFSNSNSNSNFQKKKKKEEEEEEEERRKKQEEGEEDSRPPLIKILEGFVAWWRGVAARSGAWFRIPRL